MSTAKLIIKEGKIDFAMDRYLKYFEDHEYLGNGWEVSVTPERIYAICERTYSDGMYSISSKIQHGCMVTEWKKDGKTYNRKSKRINYSGTGMLGLPGGNVSERYVYWRDEEFSQFLKDADLTAVSRLELKNGIYCINARTAHYAGGECKTRIWTDGEYEIGDTDFGRSPEWESKYPRTSAFESDTPVKIKFPTAIIIETHQHEGNNHNYSRILYTNIKGIDNMRKVISNMEEIRI